MKRVLVISGLLLLLVLLVLPPLVGSRYTILMVSQILVFATFAMSYNVMLGQTGLLSFGHAVYFGAGVYSALYIVNAIGAGSLPIPLELVPIGAALTGLLAAIVFGIISVKSGRIAFAMITLGLAELVAVCAMIFPSVFGGEQGISTDRMVDLTLTGMNYGRPAQLYWLILFWAVLAIGIMAYLVRTPLGRLANAVRDNEERVAFLGYSAFKIRYMQFCIAGAFGGLAGGLSALLFEMSNAEIFGLRTSADVLIATFLGGASHVFGPALGAALVVVLELNLAGYTEAWLLYYGLLFIAVVLFAPKGIWSVLAAIPRVIQRDGPATALRRWALWLMMLAPGFVGAVLIIEMGNHRSNAFDPSEPMALAGLTLNVFDPVYWLAGLALLLVSGTLLWRHRRAAARRHLQTLA